MRKITLGHLDISANGKKYVNQALDANRLSSGAFTRSFEDTFAMLHGCKYGIFCNSGTSALQISLAALKEVGDIQDGDEVIVPATTFIATSNVVLQNNLKPVFVDIDPRTYNIDVSKIEERITPRTRAIIPVHLFGLPANMKEIDRIALNGNLYVIEDSCETVLSSINTQCVGSFGDLACFSTYVAHLIVGGVGGLVTTNNPTLARICRSLMSHGRDSIYMNIDQDDSTDDNVLRQMVERRFNFERVGYSYRATELEAAIALSELERAHENIAKRRLNAEYLSAKLVDLENIGLLQLPIIPKGYEHSFMMYPVLVSGYFELNDFLLYLEKNGIETRLLFPLLTQPIYRKLFPGLAEEYPISKMVSSQGFFMGIHQGLTVDDLDYVSDVIHRYGWA